VLLCPICGTSQPPFFLLLAWCSNHTYLASRAFCFRYRLFRGLDGTLDPDLRHVSSELSFFSRPRIRRSP
jgi:hypothetical protein